VLPCEEAVPRKRSTPESAEYTADFITNVQAAKNLGSIDKSQIIYFAAD
jgi:hypothetical protein